MLFVDVSDLSWSLDTKSLEGFRLDWFRLAKHLAGTRRLVGGLVFDTAPDAAVGSPKQRFHDHLRYSGFRMVTRPFRPDDRGVQQEVQAALITELLSACYRDRFDVALVVSGDRSYAPALEKVSQEGKLVEVAATSSRLTAELRKSADRVHLIDELPILEFTPEGEMDDFRIEEVEA
jgi:uncharacterized LabA/DUF88 family protein